MYFTKLYFFGFLAGLFPPVGVPPAGRFAICPAGDGCLGDGLLPAFWFCAPAPGDFGF